MAMPQIRSHEESDSNISSRIDGLVDEMLAHYIDWRHDTAMVADAYRHWSNSTAGEEGALRFSAYMAALALEESSATAYAAITIEVERALQCGRPVSDPA